MGDAAASFVTPTFIRLKHRGVVQSEGTVVKIDYERKEILSPVPGEEPWARTFYTLFWEDGMSITVSPEDGWTWEAYAVDEVPDEIARNQEMNDHETDVWLNFPSGHRLLADSIIGRGPSPEDAPHTRYVRVYLAAGQIIDVEGTIDDFDAAFVEALGTPTLVDVGDFR